MKELNGEDAAQIGRFFSWIWKNWDSIRERFGAVGKWLGSSENGQILVLGAGGVGKSTLGHLLAGTAGAAVGEYAESHRIEEFRLTDDESVSLIVLPGQRHRRDSTWRDLEKEIEDGNVRGVILVNSWGYHALGAISYKEHVLWEANPAKREFLAKFLEHCRQDEIEILRRVGENIKKSPGKVWLLSLVTKEDLWWNKRSEVLDHYQAETGGYGSAVAEIQSAKGNRDFRAEFQSTSLVISCFRTGLDEELAKNLAGYGQPEQSASFQRLFRCLEGLIEWEL